jgi:hypothetical protein
MLRTLSRRAVRAVAEPRHAARMFQMARDLQACRSETRPLREAVANRPVHGTALIISLSDFVYQLKLEGILATALRLEGLEPVVLTFRPFRWPRKYLSCFGVERFIDAEDIYEATGHEDAEALAHTMLASVDSVQALKGLTHHGAQVGQQALSSISRHVQRGRLTLADEDVREALPTVLRDAIAAVHAGERLLDELDPQLVLFNEKGYAGFGSIYDVALERGANVVQFVSAGIHWRDALIFKRYTDETRRVHPASLAASTWARVKELPWGEEQERELDAEFALRYGDDEKHPDAGLQEGKRIKTRAEVQKQLALDPAKKTAVIYSHVLWDANLFYGEDLFDDQETWLVESVRAATENPNVNWIVKLHPANMWKARAGELNDEVAIRERVGDLPPHVKLLRPETDINTFSLFEVADYGITIRGTIGIELPCFGIPTLTAGTGRYSGMGFTIDSSTAEEYLDRLRTIEGIPPLSDEVRRLGRRHAHALFRLRPLRFTSYEAHFMPATKLLHPLATNLHVTPRSREDVEGAPDLREFGTWALGDEPDYVNWPPSS